MKCRHCKTEITLPLVDLGSPPPSNAYLTEHNLHIPEKWFPLRVYAQRADTGEQSRKEAVDGMLRREANYGLTRAEGYAKFQAKSDAVKDGFLSFLLEARHHRKEVAAYGAGGLWTASRRFSPPRIPQPSFMREVGLCGS